MKKTFLIATVLAAFLACNGPAKTDEKTASTEPVKSASTEMDNPDYQKGLDLVAKSDCFTCHKLNEAATGPAYSAVAAKYPNNDSTVSMLAGKIIKGGGGNWGEVPMTAHPALSKSDAEQMVKYIMLVK